MGAKSTDSAFTFFVFHLCPYPQICLRLAADLHNNHSTTPSPPAAELRARVVSRREDEVTVQLPTLPKGGNLAPVMQPWAAIWRRTSSESTSDTSSGNFMGEGPKLRVHARLVLDRAALSLMHASLKVLTNSQLSMNCFALSSSSISNFLLFHVFLLIVFS